MNDNANVTGENGSKVLPIPESKPRRSLLRRKWKFAALAVLGIVGGAAASTEFRGTHSAEAVEKTTEAKAVTVVSPRAMPATTELLLPAQLLPYEQATLFARTDGYIAKWVVDRGARVKAGDLLAVIDAPDLDQLANRSDAAVEQGRAMLHQLRADWDQAQADVDSSKARVTVAEANREFAAAEFLRSEQLGPTASRTELELAQRNRDATKAEQTVTRAEVNTKEKLVLSRKAAIATQEATIRGLEAESQRLRAVQGFKRITAPFDGTITRRFADVGMIVSTVTPQALFHIQNSATLRVQVDVPQGFAVAAKKALTGDVIVPEFPNRPLPARVARTANALDPVTRTLRVELELPNEDRSVFAGTYVQVRLLVPPSQTTKLVPISALRYTPQGVEVVAVSAGMSKVIPVKLGRDYGRAVEVLSGLNGDERLVVNPTDDLQNGQTLRLNNSEKPPETNAVELVQNWPSTSGR